MLTLTEILDKINKPEKRGRDYQQWQDVYLGMSLHIDGVCPSFVDERNGRIFQPSGWNGGAYDDVFERHLLNKFPTEQEWVRNWRKMVYRPLTRAPFLQAISVVTGAILQDSAYTLSISNKKDSDYIWGTYFEGKDLIQYVSGKFQNIAEDPNGVFVVIPKKSVSETAPTEEIEPIIKFIFSEEILFISEDEIIYQEGETIWVINKEAIYRFVKPPKSKYYVNRDGVNGWYYVHALGRLPIEIAGGVWNTQGYYDSWFVNAKPIADEHISSYSDLQFINKDATHPYVVEAESTCPKCHGIPQGQHCRRCNKDGPECICTTATGERDTSRFEITLCGSCHGSGKVARNPGDRMIAPPEMMGDNLIQIINRDVSANKYLFDYQTNLYNQIFRALYLNYIEQAQSGVAKDKDMEARYQFLSKIAGDLFDRLLYGLIGVILGYRNITVSGDIITPDMTGFTIIKPTHFNIQTAYDLLEEYQKANESKMPPYQRAAILQSYNNKQFSGDELLNRKASIVNELDIMNVLTEVEITQALMNGGASRRDYQFHLRLPTILNRIIREKGKEWLLSSTFENIEAEIQRIFAEIVPPVLILVPEDDAG